MKSCFTPVAGAFCAMLLLAGCETGGFHSQEDHRELFRDGAQADVIVRFNRWDTIHLLRPDSREGGFLPILQRADVQRELRTRQMNHNLAVVILGFRFPGGEEARYAGEWSALLSELGFKRVVVVRTGNRPSVDGLPVVMDSAKSNLGGMSSTGAALATASRR